MLEEESLCTVITSIGVPILCPNGRSLLRGPRINIPESAHRQVSLSEGSLNAWARKGWVDLRPENFLTWQDRFRRMQRTRHMLHTRGTSSVTMKTYLPDSIEIGVVVAWLLNNDRVGHRIK